MMTAPEPRPKASKPKARPSTNFFTFGALALCYSSMGFLMDALFGFPLPVGVRTTQGTAMVNGHELPLTDSVMVEASRDSLGTPVFLVLLLAHLALVLGSGAAAISASTGVERALSPEHSTADGLRRITRALWTAATSFAVYALAGPVAGSIAPHEWQGLTTMPQLAPTLWGFAAILGTLWAVRRTVAWGLRHELDTDGLV